MSRRSDEAQRSAMFRVCLQHLIDCRARGSGGSHCDLKRTSAANSVRFNSPAAVLAEAFDSTDVTGGVNSLKLLLRRDGDLPFRTRLIELLCDEFRSDTAKPLRLFRMLAGVVFQEDRIGEEDGHEGLAWGTLVGGLCQTRGCSTTIPRRL